MRLGGRLGCGSAAGSDSARRPAWVPPGAGQGRSGPILGRILADETVDRLPEQVGVTDVPGVFVVQVDQQAPRARFLVRADVQFGELVQAAVGDEGADGGT
jgi:hypothetical protein